MAEAATVLRGTLPATIRSRLHLDLYWALDLQDLDVHCEPSATTKTQIHHALTQPQAAQRYLVDPRRQDRPDNAQDAVKRRGAQPQANLHQERNAAGGPGLRMAGHRVIDGNVEFLAIETGEQLGQPVNGEQR